MKMKRSDIDTFTVLLGCAIAHTTHQCMSFEAIYWLNPAPLKVIYAAMEREEDRGYLAVGVSLRTAALTEEGKLKLKELYET